MITLDGTAAAAAESIESEPCKGSVWALLFWQPRKSRKSVALYRCSALRRTSDIALWYYDIIAYAVEGRAYLPLCFTALF
jgi:hypothetical protein